jgi:hypothetical protein
MGCGLERWSGVGQGKRGALGRREGGKPGGTAGKGKEGMGIFLFSHILFISSSFLFFLPIQIELINKCMLHRIIYQTKKCNMLWHDGTIKPPPVFYFSRLTHTHIYKKVSSLFLGKREGKQGNERVTLEFGGY